MSKNSKNKSHNNWNSSNRNITQPPKLTPKPHINPFYSAISFITNQNIPFQPFGYPSPSFQSITGETPFLAQPFFMFQSINILPFED